MVLYHLLLRAEIVHCRETTLHPESTTYLNLGTRLPNPCWTISPYTLEADHQLEIRQSAS